MNSDETLIPGTSGGEGGLERPGDQVGPYKLLAVLGEGGFGTVWLAERRQPFVQQVALKIVKAGMDSKAVIARFEQERQALAVMNHPHVAKVLDGGLTSQGRPYFAMEFVKGSPITEFCDGRKLPVKERLSLFLQVCGAVQHAHTKGIIHRDLKPSNVLVSVGEDDQPSAKVIDFGIAKAVTGRMTEQTVFTETGQMIGTPEYMSPEQADPGEADIDTRTDVYSLGVILYELLAGALPFDPKDLRSRAYREIQRIIREDDPPTPSARLSTIATKDAAAAGRIAEARQQTPKQLQRMLRSELEWIPLKATRKDRQERYMSPEALAADVQRYLDGAVLEAGPTTLGYRIGKWLARREPMLAWTLVAVGWLAMPLLFAPVVAITGRATMDAGERLLAGVLSACIATLIPTGMFLLLGRVAIKATSAIQRLSFIALVLMPAQVIAVISFNIVVSIGEGSDAFGLEVIFVSVLPILIALPVVLVLSPLVARQMRMPILASTAVAWVAIVIGALGPWASLWYQYGAANFQVSAVALSRSRDDRLAASDLATLLSAFSLAIGGEDAVPLFGDTHSFRLGWEDELRAKVLWDADEWDNAIAVQRRALEANERFIGGNGDLPWLRFLESRRDRVKEELERYERWQVSDAAKFEDLALADWSVGKKPSAVNLQRRAVETLRKDVGRQPPGRRDRARRMLEEMELRLAQYEREAEATP